MTNSAKNTGHKLAERDAAGDRSASHIVFDFTGLHQPGLTDLSMILTARLLSAPSDNVWVRSLPWRVAAVLEALGLSHLFRRYPETVDEMN